MLAPFRAELGLPPEPPAPPPAGTPIELLEASVDAGASVITTFEDPTPAMPLARAAGVPLLAMVTTSPTRVAQSPPARPADRPGHRGRRAPQRLHR